MIGRKHTAGPKNPAVEVGSTDVKQERKRDRREKIAEKKQKKPRALRISPTLFIEGGLQFHRYIWPDNSAEVLVCKEFVQTEMKLETEMVMNEILALQPTQSEFFAYGKTV